jgi:hypothetical protein
MSGWGDLGAALAGGGGSGDLAGMRGYQLGLEAARGRASLDQAMYEARKKRDEEIGRQNLVEAARKAGDDDLANFFLQSTNPASIGNYQLDRQKLQHGDAAWSAATAPNADMNAVNRMLAVMAGKPVDLTKIEGNTVVNPTVTPDQQALATTDLGRAMIGAQNALAAKRGGAGGGGSGHAGSAADAMAAALASDVHGDSYLSTLDPTQAAQVRALAEGRMAFPTGTALKSDYWQRMLADVAQYDPSFEAANYGSRAATRKDFTSGKAATAINALNTVAGHLGDLSDAADQLDNFGGVLTPLNGVVNFYRNATGDPRVKTFDATKKAAVDELTRVYRGTGGSEADIKTWSDALNASGSPEQLQHVIGQINELLHSKIAALGDQYQQGMGTIASQRDFISPNARAAFKRIQQRSGVATHGGDDLGAAMMGAGSAPAAGGHAPGSVITVGGRQWRVVGGDPNDPELEPL